MGFHYTYAHAGEFGIVYKGVLTDWNNVPMQGVAVKTLKGITSQYTVITCIHACIIIYNLIHLVCCQPQHVFLEVRFYNEVVIDSDN